MTTVRDERLPTFLVIGASKTGTTSLHHYLSQHPDIYMSPEKEPGFFLFEGKPAVDRRLRDRPFVSSLNRCEAPTLDADLRATLTRQLGAEIDALEDLLDRDLSHWHT